MHQDVNKWRQIKSYIVFNVTTFIVQPLSHPFQQVSCWAWWILFQISSTWMSWMHFFIKLMTPIDYAICCLSIWIQLRYILGIHLNSNLQNILIKLDNTLCHRKKWVLHYWNVNLSLQFCGFSNHVHVCHFRSKSLHLNINLNLWLPLNLGANR